MSSFKDTTKLLNEDGDKGNKTKELKYKLSSASLKSAAVKSERKEGESSHLQYQQLKDNNNKKK